MEIAGNGLFGWPLAHPVPRSAPRCGTKNGAHARGSNKPIPHRFRRQYGGSLKPLQENSSESSEKAEYAVYAEKVEKTENAERAERNDYPSKASRGAVRNFPSRTTPQLNRLEK